MSIDPKITSTLEEEAGHVALDSVTKTPEQFNKHEEDELLVAGLGHVSEDVAKIFLRRRALKIFNHVRTRNVRPPLDPAEVRRSIDIVNEFAKTPKQVEKQTATRRTNVERHHQGAIANLEELSKMDPSAALDAMQSADDIGRYLEAAGKVEDLSFKRKPQADYEKYTESFSDAAKELEPFLSKDRVGLMTPQALHAGRRMIATLGEQVTDLAGRVAAGDATPETLLKYQQKSKAFTSLQKFMEGETREVARALAQQNMIARTLDSKNAALMAEAIEATGGDPRRMIEHARIMKADIEKYGALEGIKRANSSRVIENSIGFGVELWKASVLSGPKTHAVNVASTGLMGAWENYYIRGLIAPAVGKVRRGAAKLLRRDAREAATFKEGFAGMVAGLTGIGDAARAAKQTLIENQSMFGKAKSESEMGYVPSLLGAGGKRIAGRRGEKVGQIAGEGLTVSFRLLEAEDEFFKTIAFNEEITRLAIRDGIANGKSGAELMQHAAKIADDPPDEMFNAAVEYAKKRTFTDSDYGGLIGAMTAGAKTAVQKFPPLGFITPFINTPGSIANYLLESTPAGMVNVLGARSKLRQSLMKGGAEADLAIARMLGGTSLAVGAYFAYDANILTGQGPDNPNLRKAMAKTGWQPNSILLNGKYYQINRLDPLGKLIGIVADNFDKAKYSGDQTSFQDYFMNAAFSMGDLMLDSTYMQGVSDLLDAIHYQGNSAAKFVSNYASAFVPYSAAMKTARDYIDPQRRMVDKLFKEEFFSNAWHLTKEQIANRFPGQSFNLRPDRYWDGSIATPDTGRVAYALSPVRVSAHKGGDAATNELIKNQYAPALPSHTITIAGMTFSLLDFDDNAGLVYDKYIQEVGEARRKEVEKVINDSAYRKLSGGMDSEKSAILRSAVARADKRARFHFLKKSLPDILQRFDGSESVLRKALHDQDLDMMGFLKGIKKSVEANEKIDSDIKKRMRIRGAGNTGGAEYLPPAFQP